MAYVLTQTVQDLNTVANRVGLVVEQASYGFSVFDANNVRVAAGLSAVKVRAFVADVTATLPAVVA